MINVINMELQHEKFGKGLLKNFEGTQIVVRFSHGDETLPFPQAFESGLKTTKEEDGKKIEEIKSRWNELYEYTQKREKDIQADPRVEAAKTYDERKRLEQEEDKKLAEAKQQKKQQYKEEAEKASAAAQAKKEK